MEVVNHHTLSDFRVAQALEQILSEVLALLSKAELIDLEQVAAARVSETEPEARADIPAIPGTKCGLQSV